MIFGRKMLLWGILFIIFASSAMSAGHEELLIADSKMRPNHQHGVETIQVLLFGKVNFYDALQIRRLLRPWVEPANISFRDYVDEHGRRDLFTTEVQIQVDPKTAPRIYKIIQQLRDQRFRGTGAVSQTRVLKTEVTVSGEMPTYANWARSYIRNVPFWRNWQGDTSSFNHVLVTGLRQKFVFHRNRMFDALRYKLGESPQVPIDTEAQVGKVVKMKAVVAGFDGPYPVMSVRKFQVDYIVPPRIQKPIEDDLDVSKAEESRPETPIPEDSTAD